MSGTEELDVQLITINVCTLRLTIPQFLAGGKVVFPKPLSQPSFLPLNSRRLRKPSNWDINLSKQSFRQVCASLQTFRVCIVQPSFNNRLSLARDTLSTRKNTIFPRFLKNSFELTTIFLSNHFCSGLFSHIAKSHESARGLKPRSINSGRQNLLINERACK